MNFFRHQQQAREQTTRLVLLFLLAVLAILATINGVMVLLWSGGWPQPGQRYPEGFFAVNTLLPLALIAGGTLVEIVRLRDGGEAVAKMAGGRPVPPDSKDASERRLINVVQEMSLAAGIACPKVYVLDHEDAINAFAAGYNPNEAVVAVTRGALARLTRDELQGVVAHEFSHILNGDMRLNVRLIGVLFGLQMIAGFGRALLDAARFTGTRARKRDDKGPPVQLILLGLGITLLVTGYIGIFFGRLIKAAVSRQREFLADASAVQFTRNPDTIGGALRKIGGLASEDGPGSRIHHRNAEHLSHLFLGAINPQLMSGWLATHPPLAERLQRIYGRPVAPLAAPEIDIQQAPEPMLPDLAFVRGGPASAGAQDAGIAGFGHPARAPAMPDALAGAIDDPDKACALAYAVLLDDGAGRAAQLALLQDKAPRQAPMIAALDGALARLPRSARLPLLDLAMPALRQLPQAGRDAFLAVVDQLIAADGRVTLAEFVVQTILCRRLAAHAGRATPVRFNSLAGLRDDCAVLLSLVAQVAAAAGRDVALDRYLRGMAAAPEAGLSVAGLGDVAALGFAPVRRALDRANQLAPLKKPALIKMLLAAATEEGTLPDEVADVLRAVCAALDAPVPPAVSASFALLHTNA